MTAELIKQQFQEWIDSFVDGEVFSTGAIIGVLQKGCRGKTERRHEVLKALTGKASSKELLAPEWYALLKFVKPVKIGNHWTTERGEMELEQMCNTLVDSLNDQPGQMSFYPKDGEETHLSFEDDLAGYEPPF